MRARRSCGGRRWRRNIRLSWTVTLARLVRCMHGSSMLRRSFIYRTARYSTWKVLLLLRRIHTRKCVRSRARARRIGWLCSRQRRIGGAKALRGYKQRGWRLPNVWHVAQHKVSRQVVARRRIASKLRMLRQI